MSRGCFLFAFVLLTAVTAGAAERFVRLEAADKAGPGTDVTVKMSAGTDAGRGEQVGFFQADASVDDGRTWTPLMYLDGLGPVTEQVRTVRAGAAGTTVRVRLRVAFRGGLAGNVDYRGHAIRWKEDWNGWSEPPAKSVAVAVE